jgi:hypothetical protein
LITMIRSAIDAGFVTPAQLEMISVHASVEALLDDVADRAARATSPDDLRRI